jgi:hypothetical protein
MSDGDYNLRLTSTATSRDHYIVCEIRDEDDVPDPTLEKTVDSVGSFIKAHFLGGQNPSRQGTSLF